MGERGDHNDDNAGDDDYDDDNIDDDESNYGEILFSAFFIHLSMTSTVLGRREVFHSLKAQFFYIKDIQMLNIAMH